jgi:hypothetical protein
LFIPAPIFQLGVNTGRSHHENAAARPRRHPHRERRTTGASPAIHLSELTLTAGFRASSTQICRLLLQEPTSGIGPDAQEEENAMLKKISAVLIAATMFTAPVLAEGTAPTTPAPASQPAKMPAAPAAATKASDAKASATKSTVRKASKVKKNKAKRNHVAKRATHSKHVAKPVSQPRAN